VKSLLPFKGIELSLKVSEKIYTGIIYCHIHGVTDPYQMAPFAGNNGYKETEDWLWSNTPDYIEGVSDGFEIVADEDVQSSGEEMTNIEANIVLEENWRKYGNL
jgi:hypothetical protein